MKDSIFKLVPNLFQNLMVTLFNQIAYKKRYGGKYKAFSTEFLKNRTLSREALLNLQKKRFESIVSHAITHSAFYKDLYQNIKDPTELSLIQQLPIVDKELLRENIDKVVIQSNEKLEASKTGGTTGKSLKVYFTFSNTQERFALLDDFRSRFGYELGKKTAWFSGKSLLTSRDIKKNRFWKKDYLNKVRYYSTFHIKQEYLKYYVEDLMRFKPEYFVGFPSTMLEIAKYGTAKGYDFPAHTVRAIFPTAETVSKEMRTILEQFFKTKVYDQYASSEGAPFIVECPEGNLHLELQSGVFEVLDDNDNPTTSGRLIITSFTTEATPLIRYDIGDSITLEDPIKICSCGNNNPMVREILGRIDDYLYSPEIGKINLGNVSNTLKDTIGIRNFQAVQNEIEVIELYVIIDEILYTHKVEKQFIKNWQERIGNKMQLNMHYVDEIPVETSGKFRIVKNNIKHLI